MNSKKLMVFVCVLLFILSSIILVDREGGFTNSRRNLITFSDFVESGNVNDITLTIYHIDPLTRTPFPWRIEDLIRSREDYKIVIKGNQLREHMDLLIAINDATLTPVSEPSILNARIYFIFEANGENILDVAMWGWGSSMISMIVNGIEVEEHYIFYDIIIPFLPDDALEPLGRWLYFNSNFPEVLGN